MTCDSILRALPPLQCLETLDGARIVTQCLHPSFEPVAVYVQSHLDGFLVHDGGEAFDLAWLEGRSSRALKRHMLNYALRYGVESDGQRIYGRALTPEWLPNVILAVANAASCASNALLGDSVGDAVDEDDLKEAAYQVLKDAFSERKVTRRVERLGRHGKAFRFAFAVDLPGSIALVDTVAPNQISVSSRYTAFSAVSARQLGGAFVAHNRPLAMEDVGLLAEVADVVPLESLAARIEKDASVRSSAS